MKIAGKNKKVTTGRQLEGFASSMMQGFRRAVDDINLYNKVSEDFIEA